MNLSNAFQDCSLSEEDLEQYNDQQCSTVSALYLSELLVCPCRAIAVHYVEPVQTLTADMDFSVAQNAFMQLPALYSSFLQQLGCFS